MNLTRRESTIILLQSRHDWQATPRSQFATFGAPAGELATRRVKCQSCNGEGTLNTRGGVKPCEKCSGAGTRMVDAYTGYSSSDDGRTEGSRKTGLTRHDKRRLADQEITMLHKQTRPPQSEATLLAETPPYQWERERDRHYHHGDYQQLEHALQWLTTTIPQARILIGWAYESGVAQLGCLHPNVQTAAELSVDHLNRRMPDHVRVPHWLKPKHPAQQRRDKKRAA